jgi:hypothetical protein
MRDAARAADQSWPGDNPQFGRVWRPPPPKRHRPAPMAIGNRAAERKSGSSNAETTAPDRSAQRAVDLAARRAAELERRVLILASIGQRKAADRLTATAAKLREVVR